MIIESASHLIKMTKERKKGRGEDVDDTESRLVMVEDQVADLYKVDREQSKLIKQLAEQNKSLLEASTRMRKTVVLALVLSVVAMVIAILLLLMN